MPRAQSSEQKLLPCARPTDMEALQVSRPVSVSLTSIRSNASPGQTAQVAKSLRSGEGGHLPTACTALAWPSPAIPSERASLTSSEAIGCFLTQERISEDMIVAGVGEIDWTDQTILVCRVPGKWFSPSSLSVQIHPRGMMLTPQHGALAETREGTEHDSWLRAQIQQMVAVSITILHHKN